MDGFVEAAMSVRDELVAQHRSELEKLGCVGADLEQRVAAYAASLTAKKQNPAGPANVADVADDAIVRALGGE